MASSFALLTLPDVLLSTSAGTERGPLVVECVTLDGRAERDVVLVLRVRALEAVVDPRRHITLAAGDGDPRVYTFHALADDPSELVLTLPAVIPEKASEVTVDVDTLDAVLEQYADFTPHGAHLEPSADHRTFQLVDDGDDEDLRGRLVLIDETNGAVLGAVGERDTIRPDPVLGARGHEQDAVVIDVGADDELGARTRFAKAIPPGEHDAITKTASILSTGISRGATLLASGITTASNFYVSRATPHPSAAPAREGIASPPPPLAVQWLTSDPARRGLDTAHTYTGKAAALSKRTLDAVEGVVARAFAPSKGKGRAVPLPPHPDRGPPLMFDPNLPDSSAEKAPARPSSAQLGMSPPPYTMSGAPPALPPRKGAASAPSTPRTATPPLSDPKPESRLGKKARLVLSAQLVISTLEASSKRLGAAGADAFTGAVAHKYGPVAAQSARALTGTARNVALVYVDVAGFGRRALLKRAGKAIVKARINGHTYALTTDERGQVTEVAPASPTIETATVPGEKRPF